MNERMSLDLSLFILSSFNSGAQKVVQVKGGMIYLLFNMFRSSSSSCVGRILRRLISRAPIASLDSCRSLSDCICKIFLLINSCGEGLSANFNDKLSLRAIFAAISSGVSSSRYNTGPSP